VVPQDITVPPQKLTEKAVSGSVCNPFVFTIKSDLYHSVNINMTAGTLNNNEEVFEVIIGGCGPTGALLAANLGRLGVKHLILEKEPGITTDPRGIVLDEDGIRCVQGVGKYQELFQEVGKCK
jgi:hypothetical protein